MSIATYVLVEPNSGSYYFGSSEDVERRIERHYHDLRQGNHHCAALQALWNQYGHLDQYVYPAETREEAYIAEQSFLVANNDDPRMLNVGLQVIGGDNLTRNPKRDEIVDKMTQSLNTRYASMSDDEKKQIYGSPGSLNPMYGRTHTDEVRAASRERMLGNQYALGLARSKEQRQRLSELASARTGESNSFFGRSHSDATKEKIRQAHLGKGPPANAMKVCVNGVVYSSVRDACNQVGISYPTMVKRIKSDDPNYSFVS